MRLINFSILIILLLFSIGCKEEVQVDVNVPFKVQLTHLWAGKPVDTWEVNNDKLIYMDDYPKSTGPKVVEERELTTSEKVRLIRALNSFPFDSLEDSYEHPSIMDGLTFNFEVWLGDKYKKIYIANIYQEDVGRVIEEMNRVFSRENRFIYEEKD